MTASADPPDKPDQANDPKKGSLRALRAVNFFIADVQNGMGPYMALFLQSSVGWGPAQIGSALAAGNIAQVLAQTPAGTLAVSWRASWGVSRCSSLVSQRWPCGACSTR